jgi:hypothetical protein
MELVRNTSALTVGTVNVFKEILLLSLAAVVFGDQLTLLQMIGIGIVSVGVLMYVRWIHASSGLLYTGVPRSDGGGCVRGDAMARYNSDDGYGADGDGEGWQEYEKLLGGDADGLDEGDVVI